MLQGLARTYLERQDSRLTNRVITLWYRSVGELKLRSRVHRVQGAQGPRSAVRGCIWRGVEGMCWLLG